MKTSILTILVPLLFFGLFTNCNSNRIFDQRVDIPESGWNKDSLIYLKANIEDVSATYNIFINLRTAYQYPSSNLWLFVKSKSPDGAAQTDTLECVLADLKGKWLGDCIGDYCDFEIPYKTNISFAKAGEYSFFIQHGMRIDNLPLVLEAGLIIEKAEK